MARVRVSKATLEKHQETFNAFMKGTVYTCIGITVLLFGLWAFLID